MRRRCDHCGVEESALWWGHYWHGCLCVYCEAHWQLYTENVLIYSWTPRDVPYDPFPDVKSKREAGGTDERH